MKKKTSYFSPQNFSLENVHKMLMQYGETQATEPRKSLLYEKNGGQNNTVILCTVHTQHAKNRIACLQKA